MTLTHVNGKAIIERQPARYTKLNAPSDQVMPGTVVSSAMELLLDDGSTVFLCSHKNDPNCEYTNSNLNSITSHQRTHSDRMMAKRAEEARQTAEAEAARVQAELDERKRRKSQGGVKAAETRRAMKAAAPTEISVPHARGPKMELGAPDLAKKAQQVITAFNTMQSAADEFQKVLIGYMRAAQTTTEKPALDPVIIEKAKKYDALKGMLA
jgi:hypothetical protein